MNPRLILPCWGAARLFLQALEQKLERRRSAGPPGRPAMSPGSQHILGRKQQATAQQQQGQAVEEGEGSGASSEAVLEPKSPGAASRAAGLVGALRSVLQGVASGGGKPAEPGGAASAALPAETGSELVAKAGRGRSGWSPFHPQVGTSALHSSWG